MVKAVVTAVYAVLVMGVVLFIVLDARRSPANQRPGPSAAPALPSPPLTRVLPLAAFSAAIGAAGGWAAEWVAAFLDMGLRGAGYSDTAPQWDPSFAAFSAWYHGMPFGILFALIGYFVFLTRLSAQEVIRSVPALFVATLVGAIMGGLLGTLVSLVTAPAAFFLMCRSIARRSAERQRRWSLEERSGAGQF